MKVTLDNIVDGLGRSVFHDRLGPLLVGLLIYRAKEPVARALDASAPLAAVQGGVLGSARRFWPIVIRVLQERKFLAIYAAITLVTFLRTTLTQK